MTTYSDFKTNFDIHPNTGDVVIAKDEQSVKSSIRSIVFTATYERFHNPTFGAGVPQELFDNMGKRTEYLIQKRIESAITRFEPRVINVQANVVQLDDDNSILVHILFTTINITAPQELNVILKRLR